MTLESIEKLRDEARRCFVSTPAMESLLECADEIQAEIDSRYMLLPVDAVGVPIHVGDEVVDYETPRRVVAVTSNEIVMTGYPCTGEQMNRFGIAKGYHHAI